MVSMTTMPDFEGPPQPHDIPPQPPQLARSKLTPYDSLKELVKKKRKLHVQRHDNSVEPFSLPVGHAGSSSSNVAVAAAAAPPAAKERKIAFGLPPSSRRQKQALTHSVSAPTFKPSNFLRQALYPGSLARNKSLSSFADASNNTGKRQKVESNSNALLGLNFKSAPVPRESLLHRACCRGDGVAIRQLLQQQPFHAGNQSQLKTLKKRYNPMFRVMETRRLKETYTYPINLALRYRASNDALRELVRLAPQVLTVPDGPNKEISLHVLLKNMPSDLAIVDMILLKYPSIARWKDRHFNTPLHVACRYGCPLDVVRHLCIMYPDALFCRNFHGLTPLDLANRNTSGGCPEEVINYLWEAVAEQTEPLLNQE